MDEIKEKKTTLHFPHGLYGFESYTEFELFPAEVDPLLRMQSTENKDLSFLLVDPFVFFDDYEFDVDDDTLTLLEVEDAEDLFILALITISKTTPAIVTANLQGPVVINSKNKKAKQIVLVDTEWKTKHNLFEKNKSE